MLIQEKLDTDFYTNFPEDPGLRPKEPQYVARHGYEMANSILAEQYKSELKEWQDRIKYFKQAKAEKEEQFRNDALSEVGMLDHPKACAVFSLAWDFGHASGYKEVFLYLEQFAELFDNGAYRCD